MTTEWRDRRERIRALPIVVATGILPFEKVPLLLRNQRKGDATLARQCGVTKPSLVLVIVALKIKKARDFAQAFSVSGFGLFIS